MQRSPIASPTILARLATIFLLAAPIGSADSEAQKPLPGSPLALSDAVEQADAIAIGREFRLGMGGSIGERLYFSAESRVEESLKGDLPAGQLKFGVMVRPPETLPPADGDYVLFLKKEDVKGRTVHSVIKMLDLTEPNSRAVRKLLSK